MSSLADTSFVDTTREVQSAEKEEGEEPKAAKRPKYEVNRRSRKPKNHRRSVNDNIEDEAKTNANWESASFKAVHQGSFADPEQRRLFSVELPPLNNNADLEKRSKKKVAILLGYVGTNYGGFQINSGVRSIQAELELALLKTGLLRRENFGYPHKYSWSTSGRTDKGVHAAAQTVSLRIEWPPSDHDNAAANDLTAPTLKNDDFFAMQRQAAALIPQLNAALPKDICVLDLVRTTRPFVAKTERNRVRYRYMIPSFCFMQRESLQKLLQEAITPPPPKTTNGSTSRLLAWQIAKPELQKFHNRIASFRLAPKQREQLQQTLQQYVGTHSFHNFTRRCRAGESRAQRYILDFQVEDPVLLATPRCGTGVENDNATATAGDATTTTATFEWIPTTVTGQSFLLNQIRKMIHCAVEVARGARPAETLAEYLHGPPQQLRKPLGLAPAQGLFLDMSYYESYNAKVQRCGNQTPLLDWFVPDTAAYGRWREFCDSVLVPHVAAEELSQGNFVQYLYRLEHPAYFQNDNGDDLEDEEDDRGGGDGEGGEVELEEKE